MPDSTNITTSLGHMTDVLTVINNSFSPAAEGNLNSLLDNIYNNTKEGVIHDLGAVIRQYNRLSRDLAAINRINIDASLTRLNDGLGHDRNLRIENASANININLKVTLKTEDIERALYERVDTRPSNSPGLLRATSWSPGGGSDTTVGTG